MNTLDRLVAWHRAPSAAALPWVNPMASLPPDMRLVLKVAAGDAGALARAKAGTDTDGEELKAATLCFVRDVLLAPSSSYYRKLGVEPDAPIKRIRDHYRELISIFHPDRMNVDVRPGDADLAASVNEAYNALKHPESRARYNRLQGAGAAANKGEMPAAKQAPFHARPPSSGATGASPTAPRGRWEVDKRPGALPLWFESQSPSTIKAMALVGVLVVAVVAVMLAGGRESTMLAVTSGDAAPQALPANHARSAAVFREAPLAALLERSGLTTAPAAPVASTKPLAVARVDVRTAAAPTAPQPSGLRVAVSIPEPERAPIAPVRSAATVPIASATPPTPAVVAPTLPARASTESGQQVMIAQAIAPENISEPSPAIRPTAPTVAIAAGPESTPVVIAAAPPKQVNPMPALPSATEVDALVARFARAYDAGDLAGLLALVDPDIVQDDRIAFTFANFNRVFRETSSRRIDLQVMQRSSEHDLARIQLAARTTLSDKDSSVRAGVGELTLVVRKRGGVPVITDVRYRERGPAA